MQEHATAKATKLTVGFISMLVKCLGKQGIDHIQAILCGGFQDPLWNIAIYHHVENVVSCLRILCKIQIASMSVNNISSFCKVQGRA